MHTRRDVLATFLGAPFAAWACEHAPRPVDARVVGAGAEGGHRLRDLTTLPEVPAARVQKRRVVVVGGGPSGLAAAWMLERSGVKDVAILEAESRPGGTSAWGESPLTRYPFGAHYLPLPTKENAPLIALLQEMDALDGTDAFGDPRGAAHMLVRDPEERLFMHGYWQAGLLPRSGASAEDLRQMDAFQKRVGIMANLRDGSGRRAFSLPVRLGSDDASFTQLDRISFKDWLLQEGFTSKRVHWMANYACRDDHGTLAEHTSAWVGLFYFCSRHRNGEDDSAPFLTWPEGNGRLVQHLLGKVGTQLRLDSLVLDVAPNEQGALVTGVDASGPFAIQAERVVMAVPMPLAGHMLRPWKTSPPAFLQSFRFGSWLVANIHLDSRPRNRGVEVAWDNVLYDSPSLGYVVATHQRGPDAGPTVWTYYLPITNPDVKAARKDLLSLDPQHAADVMISDLGRAHADLRERITRVDIFKHGHAMVRPDVGFMWGGQRVAAAAPVGAVHMAHCDLSGLPLFEEAFDQGVRAAREVLTALSIPAAGPT